MKDRKTCERCRHFKAGESASDAGGVCLKKTDWHDRALWWTHRWDPTCAQYRKRVSP